MTLANVGIAWVLMPTKAGNPCVHFGGVFSLCPFQAPSDPVPHVYTVLIAGWKTLKVDIWAAVRGTTRKLRRKGSMLKGAYTRVPCPYSVSLKRPKVTALVNNRATVGPLAVWFPNVHASPQPTPASCSARDGLPPLSIVLALFFWSFRSLSLLPFLSSFTSLLRCHLLEDTFHSHFTKNSAHARTHVHTHTHHTHHTPSFSIPTALYFPP